MGERDPQRIVVCDPVCVMTKPECTESVCLPEMATIDSSSPDTVNLAYNEKQVEFYEDYISLPSQYRQRASPVQDLEYLTALYTYQISAIPYENLAIHYSKDRRITLNPSLLFEKITRNGRGGYCMENSIFFNRILRGLGFSAYLAGARVRPRVNGIPHGDYMGWVHSVNLVTLKNGRKYLLDVSFGGDGPIAPLPLIDGHITRNIGTQELRLVFDSLEQQTDRTQKLWIYQYRNSSSQEWNSSYCFVEFEFLQQDLEVMNYFTSTSSSSFSTYTMLVVKFLRRNTEIYGKVMLINDEIKQNDGGKTFLVKTCCTEDERIAALKTYFGIILTEEETNGIRGMVTEIIPGN